MFQDPVEPVLGISEACANQVVELPLGFGPSPTIATSVASPSLVTNVPPPRRCLPAGQLGVVVFTLVVLYGALAVTTSYPLTPFVPFVPAGPWGPVALEICLATSFLTSFFSEGPPSAGEAIANTTTAARATVTVFQLGRHFFMSFSLFQWPASCGRSPDPIRRGRRWLGVDDRPKSAPMRDCRRPEARRPLERLRVVTSRAARAAIAAPAPRRTAATGTRTRSRSRGRSRTRAGRLARFHPAAGRARPGRRTTRRPDGSGRGRS